MTRSRNAANPCLLCTKVNVEARLMDTAVLVSITPESVAQRFAQYFSPERQAARAAAQAATEIDADEDIGMAIGTAESGVQDGSYDEAVQAALAALAADDEARLGAVVESMVKPAMQAAMDFGKWTVRSYEAYALEVVPHVLVPLASQ